MEEFYPMPAFAQLQVADLDRATQWYTEVLGFRNIFTIPGPGGAALLALMPVLVVVVASTPFIAARVATLALALLPTVTVIAVPITTRAAAVATAIPVTAVAAAIPVVAAAALAEFLAWRTRITLTLRRAFLFGAGATEQGAPDAHE